LDLDASVLQGIAEEAASALAAADKASLAKFVDVVRSVPIGFFFWQSFLTIGVDQFEF